MRLIIYLIISLLISFFLVAVGVGHIIQMGVLDTLENSPPDYIESGYELLQRTFDSKEGDLVNHQDDLQKLVVEVLKIPIEKVPYEAAKLPRELRSRYDGKRALWEPYQHTAYIPLSQGSELLVLGPIAPFSSIKSKYPIIAAVYAVVVLTLLALFFTIPLIRYSTRMKLMVNKFLSGDLTARIPQPGRFVGLGRQGMVLLCELFNRMASSTERVLKRQLQLFQAVAHELRTPIARIRFSLEMLDAIDDEEIREKRYASIDEDLDEIDSLVSELLIFNRFDQGIESEAAPLELETFNPSNLIESLIEKVRFMAGERELTYTADETIYIQADMRSFGRVISNLMRNALRYANTRVEIHTSALKDGKVTLSIMDDGPGVPVDKRKAIFEPFVRGDDSRNRKSGGTGLGLAIVQRILARHGGTVHVEESPGGGATFVTTWTGMPPPPAPTYRPSLITRPPEKQNGENLNL